MVRAVACDVCHGAGKVPDTPCEVCDGSRPHPAASVTKTIDVPAGIEDGQRLRVTGAGHAGEPGAPAGDLYVEVAVAADERFERDGTDLISVVAIPATEAMLGTTVTVPTLEGEREIELAAGHPAGPRGDAARRTGLPRLGGAPPRRPAGRRRGRSSRPTSPRSSASSPSGSTSTLEAEQPRAAGTARASSAASAAPSGSGAVIRLAVRCAPSRPTWSSPS